MKANKMRSTILALAAAVTIAPLAATPATASDQTDVVATVRQYVANIDSGDSTKAQELCAPQAAIIDDFPPHVWQGSAACADWWDALLAFDKKNGIDAELVAIGKPTHVAVTGDRAYVVAPATYKYTLNGKPVLEHAVWTLALQKLPSGWRVAGWAWAQR